MSRILMVFASATGNTRDMADAIADGIRSSGISLEVKEVLDASANELHSFDGIILGAYTWGNGSLPDEFLDFYQEMLEVQLHGKKAAVFGSCDSSYAAFGAAVDILSDKLQELGAELIMEGLKIQLSPSSKQMKVCRNYGASFARQFTKILQR
jgi:flavodoxin I